MNIAETIDNIQFFGIETDIDTRRETGIEHHPKAVELAQIIGGLDYLFADNSFCFKFGGDGDNGETLTYLLDIFFEFKDKTGFKLRGKSVDLPHQAYWLGRAHQKSKGYDREGENERVKESIKPISHWLNTAVAPNESRIYCRCPVCHQTWHTKGLFSRENHLHWCWVPEFKQIAADGGEGDG